MNSPRHCNQSIFKSFIIYRQCFTLILLQKWDSGKRLSQILLTTDTTAKLQGVETWMAISQLMKAPPGPVQMVETSKSSWLGADIEVNCFLLRHQIKNISLLMCTLRMSLILWSTFCLDLTWKPNAIVHISQTLQRGISNLQRTVGFATIPLCHKLLPDFQYLSFSGTNSTPSIVYQTP